MCISEPQEQVKQRADLPLLVNFSSLRGPQQQTPPFKNTANFDDVKSATVWSVEEH